MKIEHIVFWGRDMEGNLVEITQYDKKKPKAAVKCTSCFWFK